MIFLFLIVFAADSYQAVAGGDIVKVDEHSVCRNVDNDCSLDLFIPTSTSLEWNYFRTYYPSSCCTVTADCVECIYPIDCETAYPDCEHLMDCVNNFCCDETGPFPDFDCPAACPW